MSQVSTCSKCGGNGKIITDYCQSCGGNGRVKLKRSIKVVIPPGVSDGATMQVRGEGNFDKKRGMAGDLYLVLHVDEKHGIQRDGLNLYSKVNLDYTEAILGTVMKVETVEGLRDLQIPSGIQPGDTLKMSHMGVPDINKPSRRGDHHFIVSVQIPKDISDEERALVEKLASLRASRNRHSVPSMGTPKGDFDDQKLKDALSHGSKRVASLWNSFKDFLGRRQSGNGFASVSVETSMLRCIRPSSAFMISISIVFMTTCIFTLECKIGPHPVAARNPSAAHGRPGRARSVNLVPVPWRRETRPWPMGGPRRARSVKLVRCPKLARGLGPGRARLGAPTGRGRVSGSHGARANVTLLSM
ncbi:hypothetical protein HYC85_030428 [Camellia sinensis]|uniref:Chaperone DnaJ C-terminal domain-containing protein n=1 Tax=Camellia sinensis TaxID=4442 RepID=A0A7J7G1D7_CAMSI|nr:hypothetical protein HYC85_030428 [Camellia sinensis]